MFFEQFVGSNVFWFFFGMLLMGVLFGVGCTLAESQARKEWADRDRESACQLKIVRRSEDTVQKRITFVAVTDQADAQQFLNTMNFANITYAILYNQGKQIARMNSKGVLVAC